MTGLVSRKIELVINGRKHKYLGSILVFVILVKNTGIWLGLKFYNLAYFFIGSYKNNSQSGEFLTNSKVGSRYSPNLANYQNITACIMTWLMCRFGAPPTKKAQRTLKNHLPRGSQYWMPKIWSSNGLGFRFLVFGCMLPVLCST